jgi:hypothetical protein
MKRPAAANANPLAAVKAPHASPIHSRRVSNGDVSSAPPAGAGPPGGAADLTAAVVVLPRRFAGAGVAWAGVELGGTMEASSNSYVVPF